GSGMRPTAGPGMCWGGPPIAPPMWRSTRGAGRVALKSSPMKPPGSAKAFPGWGATVPRIAGAVAARPQPGGGAARGEPAAGGGSRVGHLAEAGLSRGGGIWQAPPGAAAAPAAGPAPPARAAAPCRLRPGCPRGGLDHDPGPGTRGARGVRGRPGAVAGEQAPCPAIAPGRPVSPARLAPMPALWLCLLREAPQPECPERQAARVRLLSLPGHRRVSLWRLAGLSEYAGTDRSVGPGGVAGSLYVAEPPRATGGGITAGLAAGDAHPPHAAGHH